jgi:hypothetical protein
MSRFRLQKPLVLSSGLCLSMIGSTLMLIGFFLPLAFVRYMDGAINTFSQWILVISFTYTTFTWFSQDPNPNRSIGDFLLIFFVLVALVLPLLTTLIALVISYKTAIVRQRDRGPAILWRYVLGIGAIVEIGVCLCACFLPQMESDIFPAPGFVVLVLGSLLLLIGEVKQGRGTPQTDERRLNGDFPHPS